MNDRLLMAKVEAIQKCDAVLQHIARISELSSQIEAAHQEFNESVKDAENALVFIRAQEYFNNPEN